MPVLGVMIDIMENTAQKFADRAGLGKGGASVYTPFAAKLFETERKHSVG